MLMCCPLQRPSPRRSEGRVEEAGGSAAEGYGFERDEPDIYGEREYAPFPRYCVCSLYVACLKLLLLSRRWWVKIFKLVKSTSLITLNLLVAII